MSKERITTFLIDTALDANRGVDPNVQGMAIFGFLVLFSHEFGDFVVRASIHRVAERSWEFTVMQQTIGEDPTVILPDCARVLTNLDLTYSNANVRFNLQPEAYYDLIKNSFTPAPLNPDLMTGILKVDLAHVRPLVTARITLARRTSKIPGEASQERPIFPADVDHKIHKLSQQALPTRRANIVTSGFELLTAKTSIGLGEHHGANDALIVACLLLTYGERITGMRFRDLFLESHIKGLTNPSQIFKFAERKDQSSYRNEQFGYRVLIRVANIRGVNIHGLDSYRFGITPNVLRDRDQPKYHITRLANFNISIQQYINRVISRYGPKDRCLLICGGGHVEVPPHLLHRGLPGTPDPDYSLSVLLPQFTFAFPILNPDSRPLFGMKTLFGLYTPSPDSSVPTMVDVVTELPKALNLSGTQATVLIGEMYSEIIRQWDAQKVALDIRGIQEFYRKKEPEIHSFLSFLGISGQNAALLIELLYTMELSNLYLFLKVFDKLIPRDYLESDKIDEVDSKWHEYINSRPPDEF